MTCMVILMNFQNIYFINIEYYSIVIHVPKITNLTKLKLTSFFPRHYQQLQPQQEDCTTW